jgi:pyrroloquinoline quinone biosynthesis protein B
LRRYGSDELRVGGDRSGFLTQSCAGGSGEARSCDAGDHPRVGGRRRRPAMELRLPDLSSRLGRRSPGGGADPVEPCRLSRRGAMASHQRIAGHPSAVLLTNGDVDHVAGLLSLRESQAFALYGTRETLSALAANTLLDVLNPDLVTRRETVFDRPIELLPGLRATLFPVPGKPPLWLEGPTTVIGALSGSTVGVLLEAGGGRLAYVPGCALVDDELVRRLDGVDALLFDGTVFHDDDMLRAGVGTKTGRRMGHVPMRGPGGSIAGLAGLNVGRRIFVHINNTNPVLVEGSDERRDVEAAGWTVAHDGLRIDLGSPAARRG